MTLPHADDEVSGSQRPLAVRSKGNQAARPALGADPRQLQRQRVRAYRTQRVLRRTSRSIDSGQNAS